MMASESSAYFCGVGAAAVAPDVKHDAIEKNLMAHCSSACASKMSEESRVSVAQCLSALEPLQPRRCLDELDVLGAVHPHLGHKCWQGVHGHPLPAVLRVVLGKIAHQEHGDKSHDDMDAGAVVAPCSIRMLAAPLQFCAHNLPFSFFC